MVFHVIYVLIVKFVNMVLLEKIVMIVESVNMVKHSCLFISLFIYVYTTCADFPLRKFSLFFFFFFYTCVGVRRCDCSHCGTCSHGLQRVDCPDCQICPHGIMKCNCEPCNTTYETVQETHGEETFFCLFDFCLFKKKFTCIYVLS